MGIDTLVYDFKCMSIEQNLEITEKPEDGCYIYGLFMEGAKFDYKNMVVGESDPKILFTQSPTILLIPTGMDELKTENIYECPMYRTSERRGVLLTTGHSTNFVCVIFLPTNRDPRHWIKRG